ncbi:hypothetical protein Pla86_01120 [Planctomycetes bacterium Pla86]|uniref:Uncharacterized protein n=2 Tax=Engelhardtia mirabilis TaxID=2528011 RepID=A0A518BDI8_9BACT|nr:hypothetical protein Pla133_01120 [Planctomycetes bacterium Pla133]QDU99375.1 hypothetical protein Pla86_01120 [Planctomycetes bacterium Pla86]
MLFEPRYWRDRLEDMSQVPRQLLVLPRQELALPGGEASELWLRAHDRVRLRALFARSVVLFPRPVVRLSLTSSSLQAPRLDWDSIADGQVQLVVENVPGRRLEDRVLDLLRTIQAAREQAQLDDGRLTLRTGERDAARDEVMIVDRLLSDGRI